MTNFVTPRTWNIGELVTKAMLDEQIRDNLNAIWVGSAAGDIDYYSAANTKTRLAKPSTAAAYLLKNTSTGVPAWLIATSIPGALHAKATVENDTGGMSIAGDSTFHNITGLSVNLVTTVQCTVVIRGWVRGACVTAGNSLKIRASIGANNDPGEMPETSSPYYVPMPYEWYKTGLAAGTYACKFMAWANGAGGTIGNARLTAYAIPE